MIPGHFWFVGDGVGPDESRTTPPKTGTAVIVTGPGSVGAVVESVNGAADGFAEGGAVGVPVGAGFLDLGGTVVGAELVLELGEALGVSDG